MVLLITGIPEVVAPQEWEQRTHDGLVLLSETKVAAAWVKPEADFSGFRRVLILEAHVAFLKTWQHDHNRTSVNRVSNRDLEWIKAETGRQLR